MVAQHSSNVAPVAEGNGTGLVALGCTFTSLNILGMDVGILGPVLSGLETLLPSSRHGRVVQLLDHIRRLASAGGDEDGVLGEAGGEVVHDDGAVAGDLTETEGLEEEGDGEVELGLALVVAAQGLHGAAHLLRVEPVTLARLYAVVLAAAVLLEGGLDGPDEVLLRVVGFEDMFVGVKLSELDGDSNSLCEQSLTLMPEALRHKVFVLAL